MKPSIRSSGLFLALLALTAGCSPTQFDVTGDEDDLVLSAEEGELRSNASPDRVVVYSNNIENMIFDWKDLVHFMAEDALRPDIFLVQQVSGKEGMDRLVTTMSRRLGVDYDGVVAQKNPTDTRFQGQVLPKPSVTTGIIFRSNRFTYVNHDSWFPFGKGFKNQVQTCDARTDHSGYETLRVKLFDKIAKKYVVVVGLRHWTWHPCSTQNVFEIVDGLPSGPMAHPGLGSHAALHIIAGDFNDRAVDPNGNYACWYRELNGAIKEDGCSPRATAGFTDPLYEFCKGAKSCVRERGGIDYIFVRRSDGQKARTSHFDIISTDQATRASRDATGKDGPSNLRHRDGYNDQGPYYSQHRARRAYVYYE